MVCTQKFVENFANGITVFNVYIADPYQDHEFSDDDYRELGRQVSLLYVLPRDKLGLFPLFAAKKLTFNQVLRFAVVPD